MNMDARSLSFPRNLFRHRWPIAGGIMLVFLSWLLSSLGIIPNFSRARENSGPPITEMLRVIDGAKELWALENHKLVGAVPTESDLSPYLKDGRLPKPRFGEKYQINPFGEPATLVLTRDWGTLKAGTILSNNMWTPPHQGP